MKLIKKEPKKAGIKKTKNKSKVVPKKSVVKKGTVKKDADVQRLVHLLQVHQIELEHQNQELRIAQEELEVSRNKYVNLFDFSPIPYFSLGYDGKIKEVNLSAGNMFGTERSKLIDKHFSNYIPLEGKEIFKLFLISVFSSKVKHSCELKIISKDKRLFHVRLEGLVLEDALEPEEKCQVAVIDLTEYKNIEDSLKEATEKLKVLNVTKDKIFSIISHDLRSPFQSLLGSSELLATEIENLSHDEIILFSKTLNNNLVNIYGLLDNLLHWSLMQRNLLEYEPVNLNLNDLVSKIIAISNQNALKKNISISNNIDNETVVYADADMLRTVVQNLITNALKFTRPEGRIIISSVEKNDFVEIDVQDTGIGLEPEKASKLFNFDTLFTTNGTDGEKGTGLGLSLCKEFIERNGGRIWVESELGKGSKFTITLPKTNL
jgi:PAS domain S-box-containing protein